MNGSQTWAKLSCRPLRYYQGAPETFCGTFETENLIVWRILKGTVAVDFPDLRLEGKADSWVVLTRGRRAQEFSPGAMIESIHLALEFPSARWIGPRGAVLESGPPLERASANLGRAMRNDPPESLARHALEQEAAWRFLAELAPRLQRAGIGLVPLKITDPRLARSLALIEKLPPALPWDGDLIARTVGLSANQLDRIWQKERAQTPYRYWEDRRLRFAREKLENTGWSVKELASELGFSQLAQFSNWFRRRQGVSPRQYREKLAA